eukprot:Sspe_Gene.10987::Locus_3704_Transcript_1_1_Confidence_1.000_Length_2511::g.10987::m.10987
MQKPEVDVADRQKILAIGAERMSPQNKKPQPGQPAEEDSDSDDNGWGNRGGREFPLKSLMNFSTQGDAAGGSGRGGGGGDEQGASQDGEDSSDALGASTQTAPDMTPGGHPMPQIRSPGERRTDDFAKSYPPRTPNAGTTDDGVLIPDAGGFMLDSPMGVTSPNVKSPVLPPRKPPLQYARRSGRQPTATQTPAEWEAANERTLPSQEHPVNPTQPMCTVVLNGLQCLYCNCPRNAREVAFSMAPTGALQLFGESNDLFLQLLFTSPNFPQRPPYHVEGTLELLDNNRKVIRSVKLGLIEEPGQVEKKQVTLLFVPAYLKLVLHHIPSDKRGPNETQLLEEIFAVMKNRRLNPCGGSLPSVTVQHRAKESPLYEKVVGRNFQNSWHQFMKAHSDKFSLFHYTQSEIIERKLSPLCKSNEARIVLREHQQNPNWKKADELAAKKHAEAEEGLKQKLIMLLKQRDYDQRELLEELHGDENFKHFLSPTFSILMRTLSRHKGLFITSADKDQPTRVGLARPLRTVYTPQVVPSLARMIRPPDTPTQAPLPTSLAYPISPGMTPQHHGFPAHSLPLLNFPALAQPTSPLMPPSSLPIIHSDNYEPAGIISPGMQPSQATPVLHNLLDDEPKNIASPMISPMLPMGTSPINPSISEATFSLHNPHDQMHQIQSMHQVVQLGTPVQQPFDTQQMVFVKQGTPQQFQLLQPQQQMWIIDNSSSSNWITSPSDSTNIIPASLIDPNQSIVTPPSVSLFPVQTPPTVSFQPM